MPASSPPGKSHHLEKVSPPGKEKGSTPGKMKRQFRPHTTIPVDLQDAAFLRYCQMYFSDSANYISLDDDEVVPSSKYHYWNWIQDTAARYILIQEPPPDDDLMLMMMMMMTTMIMMTIMTIMI